MEEKPMLTTAELRWFYLGQLPQEISQWFQQDFLDGQLGETEFNKEYFVAGLLHHDLYHLGQIGLILKWAK